MVEDAIEAVDSDAAILRSFRVKNGHVLSFPMRKRSQQEQQATLYGSEGFLEEGKHEVFHEFVRPSGRDDQYTIAGGPGEDQPDSGGIGVRASVHFNLPPSRLSSAEHSEVFSPVSDGVEVINMEEEEDEEMRRLHAHKKWNERRRQIEAEFQRLRHFSIQQQRAGRMRHSVSFGDDLEVQVAGGTDSHRNSFNSKKRNFSTNTGMAGSGVAETTGAPFIVNRNSVPVMHQLERSISMPLSYGEDGRSHHQPKLETYEEVDEEEEDDDVFDDNILMGLPPKDIPRTTISSSAEQLPSLNMDEIPFVDVHHQSEYSRRRRSREDQVSHSSSRQGSKGRSHWVERVRRGSAERAYGQDDRAISSSSRRETSRCDQVNYSRQESPEHASSSSRGRESSRHDQVNYSRQELADDHTQEGPVAVRHTSRGEGQNGHATNTVTRKGVVSKESSV